MGLFGSNPRLHANFGVITALALIVGAALCEIGLGDRGRTAALLFFTASYPFAVFGCAGYAASKGYGVWWGILPALVLNLLALNHLANLPDRAANPPRPTGTALAKLVDAFMLILTAAMVFALLFCLTIAWGGNIEPRYRLPGKVGVALCLAYFLGLFLLPRWAAIRGRAARSRA